MNRNKEPWNGQGINENTERKITHRYIVVHPEHLSYVRIESHNRGTHCTRFEFRLHPQTIVTPYTQSTQTLHKSRGKHLIYT